MKVRKLISNSEINKKNNFCLDKISMFLVLVIVIFWLYATTITLTSFFKRLR